MFGRRGYPFAYTAASYALYHNPQLLTPTLKLGKMRPVRIKTYPVRMPPIHMTYEDWGAYRRIAQRHAALRRALAHKRLRNKGLRRLNKRTAGFLGVEHKFYDTNVIAAGISTDANMASAEQDPSATSMVSTPAQGDSEQNRDGKKIVIESFHINGIIYRAAIEGAIDLLSPTDVFIAVILDTQSNAAQFNSEDVFKNSTAQTAGNCNPFKNLLFGNRFKILKTAVFNMQFDTLAAAAANAYASHGKSKHFRWNFKFPKGLHINFNSGTTASIANVIDNSLHVIAICNNATSTPTLTYNARIRFQG